MNKILKAILILITVFAVVTVTGCSLLDNQPSGTPDPDPNPDHHHEFSSEWSMDDEYHWYASTCGHDDAVSKVAHEWLTPDCTNAKTCKDCGKVIGEALGHVWNEGTVITPSTEDIEGVVEYECLVCGEKETGKLDKLPHQHVDEDADFVCDKCEEGLSDTKRFEAEDAEYHKGTVNFENTDRASGGVCVSYFREGKVIVFTVNATKAEQNVPIIICGASAKESNGQLLEITASELTAMIKINGVAIRDVEGGFAGSATQDWYNFSILTAYIDLVEGKNVITFENLGPAMNMDYIEIQSQEAKLSWIAGIGAKDCVDAGNDHSCDVCGVSVGTHAAAAGTHVCEYCGQNVSECVDANTNHECDVCGESMGTHAAAEGSHNCDYCGKALSKCDDNYDEGKIDFDATCTEPGQKTYTCSVCGGTKVEAISQKGHSDTDGNYKCDVCGASLCENHVAAEAVKENEVAPGCVSEGKYDSVVYCKNCGDTISRETIAINPKGHNYTYSVAGSFNYNVKDGSYDASGLSIVVGCADCEDYVGETLTGCSIDLANIDTTGAVVSCNWGEKAVSCVMPAFNVENYIVSSARTGGNDPDPVVTTTLTSDKVNCTVTSDDYLLVDGKLYSRYELSLLGSENLEVTYEGGTYIYNALAPVTLNYNINVYGCFLTFVGDIDLNISGKWIHNNGIIIGNDKKVGNVVVNANGGNAFFTYDGADLIVNEGSTLELISTDEYNVWCEMEGTQILVDGTLIANGNIFVRPYEDWTHPEKDNYNLNPHIYVRKGTLETRGSSIYANFIQVGSVKNNYEGKLILNNGAIVQRHENKFKAIRWVFSNGELVFNNTGNAMSAMQLDVNSVKGITFDSGITVNVTGNINCFIEHKWDWWTMTAVHTDAKFNLPEDAIFYLHNDNEPHVSHSYMSTWNTATIMLDGEEKTVWVSLQDRYVHDQYFQYSQDDIISVENADGSRSSAEVVPAAGSYQTADGTIRVGDWNFNKAVNANGDVIYYMAIN